MFAPFILLVLLLLGLPFISLCPSLEALLISLCLLIFRSLPKTITIPFCAWNKSSLPRLPGLSCPFLSRTPMWKAPFLWWSWNKILGGSFFWNANSAPERRGKRGNFIINCRDIYTVYFINPKSQALSWYHHCFPWTGPISHLCSSPIS